MHGPIVDALLMVGLIYAVFVVLFLTVMWLGD